MRSPGGLGIDGTGLITVRTLDLDHARDPLKQIVERFRDQPDPNAPVPNPPTSIRPTCSSFWRISRCRCRPG